MRLLLHLCRVVACRFGFHRYFARYGQIEDPKYAPWCGYCGHRGPWRQG